MPKSHGDTLWGLEFPKREHFAAVVDNLHSHTLHD